MLDGAMVVVLAVAADIPHVGNCFDSEAVSMKKFAQPGQSPKSAAAEFEGLKTLFDQLHLPNRADTTSHQDAQRLA